MSAGRAGSRLLGLAVALLVAAALGLVGTGFPAAQASVPVDPAQFGYGLSLNATSPSDLMPAARSGAVRLWDLGLRWSSINPAPGRYDFGWFDNVVAQAQAAHEKPLYVLGMTPRWAASNPGDTTCKFYQPSRAATPGNEPGQCSAPRSIAYWDDYVRQVVTRYKGRIESYEVWNEANLTSYWSGSVATLAQMTQHAAAIIKSVDPAALVVSPSVIFLANPVVQHWLSAFAAQGGYRGLDRVALHLYPWAATSRPESVVDLFRTSVATLSAAGVHLPVWDTEIGFGYIWTTPNHLVMATATQQYYIARLMLVSSAIGVQRTYFYAWGNIDQSVQLVTGAAALSPAGRTADLLAGRLAGARLMYCESGDAGQAELVADEWQCAFDNGLVGGYHEYTLARWSGTYARQVVAGPGAALLTTMDGAQYGLAATSPVGINGMPVLLTYRTAASSATWGRLPARAAPPTVSAGTSPGASVAGTSRAIGGFVRSAGSGMGVPGGLVQLWRRPLGSTGAYSYAAGTWTYGNGYYGFTLPLSTSSEYQVRFGGTRTEAPVVPPTLKFVVSPLVRAVSAPYENLNGQPGRIAASVAPNHEYQTVWLQRWTGGAWTTVVVTRLSGVSTVTFAVPQPGHSVYAYRVVKPYPDALNTWGASSTVYLHWP